MKKVIHIKTLMFAGIVAMTMLLAFPAFAEEDPSVTYSTMYVPGVTNYNVDGDVTLDVNVAEINALEITLSTSNLAIDLTPKVNTTSFGNDTLDILVGTSNSTGYTLTMQPIYNGSSTTSLTRTEAVNNTNPTIDTITTALSPSTFSSPSDTASTNKWGYMLSTTTLDVDKTIYNPVLTTNTINSSTEAVANHPTSLTFGAKVDNTIPAGNYRVTLKFMAVTNYVPTTFAMAYDAVGKTKISYSGNEYYSMQDMNSDICAMVDDAYTDTLIDIRNNNTYNVAKINDNCWMNQNLRITGTISASGSNFTGNSITLVNGDGSAFEFTTYDRMTVYDPGNSRDGAYYTYAAASAGTITGNNNQSAQVYDICPANWMLPKNAQIDSLVNAAGGGVWYKSLSDRVYPGWTLEREADSYWGSEVDNSDGDGARLRYNLCYSVKETTNDGFYRFRDYRSYGHTIRCVAK